MNYSVIGIIIVVMIVWAGSVLVDGNNSMEKCMERHSRDTCISSLR